MLIVGLWKVNSVMFTKASVMFSIRIDRSSQPTGSVLRIRLVLECPLTRRDVLQGLCRKLLRKQQLRKHKHRK